MSDTFIMYSEENWALVVPMANEEGDFVPFSARLVEVLNRLNSGHVYFVIDKASHDNTLKLSRELAQRDSRFTVIWAPENRNIVDAYLRGYRQAYSNGHAIIIEMDAGLSHDPYAITSFLRALSEGNECAFGSRTINGGSVSESPYFRRVLSNGGTLLSNLLLGTKFKDMTSGFIGFRANVVGSFLQTKFHSTAHFYQTELRYLVRNRKFIEIPIHYQAPSPRVSQKAIRNSFSVLFHYFFMRIIFRAPVALPVQHTQATTPIRKAA